MSTAPRITPDELTTGVSAGGPLELAIADFAAAAVNADRVDDLITEIVRLRCAEYHDCRLCGSLRTQSALDSGFDEQIYRKIACYESSDFAPEIKAALRLCDAMIMYPWLIDDTLKQELRSYFDEQQITELCIDVMKWSQQKALVALRIDNPVSDQLNRLTFDENGHPIIGEAIS